MHYSGVQMILNPAKHFLHTSPTRDEIEGLNRLASRAYFSYGGALGIDRGRMPYGFVQYMPVEPVFSPLRNGVPSIGAHSFRLSSR